MALAWLSFLNFGGSPIGAAGHLVAVLSLQPILQGELDAPQPMLTADVACEPIREVVYAE